jgi:hypothetical protein
MKLEAIYSSETSAPTQNTAWWHNTDHHYLFTYLFVYLFMYSFI